ncbi:hypothetical protein PYW07_010646 [Mythimna separata]|uniref:Uncharacterized protein n=1 Tax=Mythimna separata TaxID=271217 RepID=A0AAD7YA73_MYTSE|nr:hypothetical protein PYW07_010646 [Mythimna separata]
MARHTLIFLILCVTTRLVLPEPTVTPTEATAEPRDEALGDSEEPPEGYYAFVESPNATPPRVRPPPYRQVTSSCAEVESNKPHVSANNLCGDLNRGVIPRNPMGQNPNGEPYPFELIRNQTLRFLSRTLPVLRADDTLPRVAHLPAPAPDAAGVPDVQHNRLEERSKRSLSEADHAVVDSDVIPSSALRAEHRAADAPRESRKFCDNGGV